MNENVRLLPGSMSEEDALTCDDPITSLIARLTVSNAHSGLTNFFNAEVGRPNATVDHILIGVAAWMMQMHASFAAYLLEADRVEDVAGQFQSIFDQIYRTHFVDSVKELEA
ncbi:hypothetical protein NAC44_20860 [Allorhizobium sp. BGMRC 0089]|uniref:hypothetical protein n=1 Tax=Allorhizobium sonneratiae TaxID=2934936 RepID=UPI00203496A2|nr:hypothetical protein [Allorhizobium sonneratiae]MCM2294781.1 hypothetical protein [Allorhizobium sonneratiae]